jgi:hypothetical protein
MRYEIIEKKDVTMIHVFEGNLFFGYNDSEDYAGFRQALIDKGIDAFVDLILEDHNTAFLRFTDQSI